MHQQRDRIVATILRGQKTMERYLFSQNYRNTNVESEVINVFATLGGILLQV